MTIEWVPPLLVAGAVGLVATPAAMRLALASGLVDRSVERRRRAMPYLGGMAIAVAVLAGLLTGSLSATAVAVVGLGALLAAVGLVDDAHPLSPLARLVVEVACAAGAVAAGVRLHGTGVHGLDIVLTVVLLVGMSNSMNLLDNMDGLAGGVTMTGAAGLLAVAVVLGHQPGAVTAAALTGACAGFLVFNAPPASVFMGDAGSLILGFLLGATAIRVGAPLPDPASLVVTFLVLLLPIADTATVFLSRARHGRSPFRGGKDHLSHRLAGSGLGSRRAVAVLVGVEGSCAALAALAGGKVIPLGAAAAGGLALVVAVVAVAGHVPVYSSKLPASPAPSPRAVARAASPRLPRPLLAGAVLVVAIVAAMPVPAVLGALRSRAPSLDGESYAEQAVTAAESGNLALAAEDFSVAHRDFVLALSDLESPLSSLGLAYPVLASNLADARLLAMVGGELSSVGAQVARTSDRFTYRVHGGDVPVRLLASEAPSLSSAAGVVKAAIDELSRWHPAYVLSVLSGAESTLRHELGLADRRLTEASAIARFLPGLLGLGTTRRYFLAFQTNSESRATGGLIGLDGVLVASGGHLMLTRVGPIGRLDGKGTLADLAAPRDYLARYERFDPAGTWQNLNMSPDFPTVGAIITHLFPRSGGEPVNGVIGVDPLGLAAMLRLVGPVQVAGWPVPLTEANVAPVLLQQSYVAYGTDEAARQAFLERLIKAVFAKVSDLTLSDPAVLVTDLSQAAAEHHLELYSSNRAAESWLGSLGLTGAIPPVRSDFFEVTTQNASGNKIDSYLERSMTYEVLLRPIGARGAGGSLESALEQAQLSVRLSNRAPSSGLPASIIGPYEPGFVPGENRTFFTLYTPLSFTGARLVTGGLAPELTGSQTLPPVGHSLPLEQLPELGRWADSSFLDIASRSSVSVGISLFGQVPLMPGGWYELTIGSQPLIRPDLVSVSVRTVPGFEVVAARGAVVVGGVASATLHLDSTRQIWVKLARST